MSGNCPSAAALIRADGAVTAAPSATDSLTTLDGKRKVFGGPTSPPSHHLYKFLDHIGVSNFISAMEFAAVPSFGIF